MTPRIVVVEDDPDIAAFVRDRLHLYGFEVIPLAGSIGAHALICEAQPNLVITDLEVEGREDGMRLLEELRADAATATLPIILYSGNHDFLEKNRDVIRGLRVRRVRKPFHPDELIGKIEAALAAA